MDKQSFVFHRDWFDFIKDEPDDFRLLMYDTITKYVFEGIEPTDTTTKRYFKLIKSMLDRDAEKYDEKVEKRREAGKKGGLQRVARLQANQANQANACKCLQDQANQADNVNDNDSDNGINNNDNTIIISSAKADDMSHSKECNASISYDGIVKYWNSLVKGKAIKPIIGIKKDSTRRTLVQARIKQYGKDAFAEGMRKAAASGFLNGGGRNGRVYSFDWFIKPNNFPKVVEGVFDDQEKPAAKGEDWSKPSAGELALRRKQEFILHNQKAAREG